MHNSQDGQAMGAGGARQGLLISSCVGCHTGDNPDSSSNVVPFVLSSSAPTYGKTGTENTSDTLAGGTFYWSYNVASAEHMGHNVAPGLAPGSTDPPGGSTISSQLNCAGDVGCHGNSTISDPYEAMEKSHHINDSTIDGSSLGTSFRFLSGVGGLEDSDWELPSASPPLSSTKHNQYLGSTNYANSSTTPPTTLTSLCVRCHGNFHGSASYQEGTANAGGNAPYTAGQSPWIRHPTDISLPTTGEYGSYVTYDPIAPVASTSTASVVSDISALSNRIITCVSCHRAHGSRWPYSLRWNYLDWPGGDPDAYNGCGICHTSKI